MNIKDLIIRSYNEAKTIKNSALSDGIKNNQRSKVWIRALAANFRNEYDKDEIRVFSRDYDENRDEFKVNELLHDITVCSVKKVKATRHDKYLCYITKANWQVESEFAKDSRQAIIDFNKLVLGSANNQLFIGSLMDNHSRFMETLSAPTKVCSWNVYTAFIPHPGDWDYSKSEPEVYQFLGNQWSLVK